MNAISKTIISAHDLKKVYKHKTALNQISFNVETGRIVGLIGPNGAGKTTVLSAILGLIPFEGKLDVLGLDPRQQRDLLMRDVCFIADVAVLPRWIKVKEAIDFVAGIHPRFDRSKCERLLANTQLKPNQRVREMSKGMIVQLHLALVMAIDAKLLVLDEPTLGLDILYRKQFYQQLLEEYFDEEKTILITTHQVEEIEHILTDVMFIREGQIALSATMDDLAERYIEVLVDADHLEQARRLKPASERALPFGKTVLLYENVAREHLSPLGEIRTPNLADLFMSLMQGAYA